MAVWTGPSNTPTGQAIAACTSAVVTAVFYFDHLSQGWQFFIAGASEAINTLHTLANLQPVFLQGGATQPPTETPAPTPTPTPCGYWRGRCYPYPAPTSGPTPLPTPAPQNRPPTVSPIRATFLPDFFTTVYEVDATDPDGDVLRYNWTLGMVEGPRCGAWWVPEGRPWEFRWAHPSEGAFPMIPCPPHSGHPEAFIDVSVEDAEFRVVCTYRGAESGVGLPCTAPSRIGD